MANISIYAKPFFLSFLSVTCVVGLSSTPIAIASDHVDSPIVTINPAPTTGIDTNSNLITVPPSKTPLGKYEDITDVYVFREGDQTGNPEDNSNLVFVMTLNGLIPPGQWRPFATDIDYVIRIARDKNNLDGTQRNISVRFGPVNENGQQEIFVNGRSAGQTTPFNDSPVINTVNLGANANFEARVFAGEMDDPFFLDFRIVTEGLGAGVNGSGVDTTRTPSDTFGNSNVNAIVVSAPVSWLQENVSSTPTSFHVWGTTNR